MIGQLHVSVIRVQRIEGSALDANDSVVVSVNHGGANYTPPKYDTMAEGGGIEPPSLAGVPGINPVPSDQLDALRRAKTMLTTARFASLHGFCESGLRVIARIHGECCDGIRLLLF